jgi:hypothetical protein
MDLEQVKTVYRAAIDPTARDGEGTSWWAAVAAEVTAVVDAPDTQAAAGVIAWWHNDWRTVGDSPARAALRIRRAAKRMPGTRSAS